MSKNLSELSGRKGLNDNLFDQLGRLAIQDGSPSKADLKNLADDFLIGYANTYGTSTFYDFLKPENKGKKIYVCNGSACLCAGKQAELIQDLKKRFSEEEIGHMTCLGRCHENRAFHYQGRNYSGKFDLDTLGTPEGYDSDQYNVRALSKEVLTLPFTTIDDHYKVLHRCFQQGRDKTLEEIKLSGIRGRGGAGFPMGLKLEFCKKAEGNTKFIICNADEGDPGAYSDRYLLDQRPHSVLFGMMVAGFITGSEYGVLYIRAEYPNAIRTIQEAIDDLYNSGWLGKDIQDSGFTFNFKVIRAQGAYICGEETALINSIEGQRPEVRVRPPYPAQNGLFNQPTVVNNVETLAALHFIISEGGTAWKALGTEKSSGTKLVSLDGHFQAPGIYEVEMGTPLSNIIYDLGRGFTTDVKAMQIGGPLGGIVPLSKVEALSLDFESFSNHGFLLGHASIVSIPSDFPMIKYIQHLFDFAAYESCGKCFPCRLGTKRGHEMTTMAIEDGHPMDRQLLDDLLTTLEQGSLCAHGGGIPLPVKNAMEYFSEELRPFFQETSIS